MGFFDEWKVTLITTDKSKQSKSFYHVGIATSDEEADYFEVEEIVNSCNEILHLEEKFHLFFNQGKKSEKNDAIAFLVAFASYAYGVDRRTWDWQQVRHQSQGLYESMVASPSHFLHHNIPLINEMKFNIKRYIDLNFFR
jgi:hypothetical protein